MNHFERPAARIAAIALMAAVPLPAQQVVRGKVIDSLKAPMPDVEVISGPLRTKSGADGRFVLDGFPMGSSRLILRRVGYAPVSVTLNFYSPDTLEQTFTMYRATALDTVTVRADASTGGDPTFERRRQDIEKTGFGKVLDEAYLAKSGTTQLSNILAAQTGFRIKAVRGQSYLLSRRMTLGNGSGRALPCYAQVYQDGVRIYPGGSEPGMPNMDNFSIGTIYAIELYRGAAETPAELNSTGSACGTVVIWTKRGPSK